MGQGSAAHAELLVLTAAMGTIAHDTSNESLAICLGTLLRHRVFPRPIGPFRQSARATWVAAYGHQRFFL
eukprot:4327434-Alexandrium_andersonii.AAC.1